MDRGDAAQRGPSLNLREPFDRMHADFPAGTPAWRDASFTSLLGRAPELASLPAMLPASLSERLFAGQECVESLASAYQDHGYGLLMYALARLFKPRTCVELGVLHGFSLLSVAAALRDNGSGSIDGFDLFDDYPFRHESLANAEAAIRRCKLQAWARVHRTDAFGVHERFRQVDWLHVDVSNDGATFARIFEQWEARVRTLMILEGGSAERDRVEWMRKYAKRPIVPALDALCASHPGWRFAVLAPFPSITVALRSGPRA